MIDFVILLQAGSGVIGFVRC